MMCCETYRQNQIKATKIGSTHQKEDLHEEKKVFEAVSHWSSTGNAILSGYGFFRPGVGNCGR